MKNQLIDWALLVVPGVMWGASFLFIAEGLAALEPGGVTFCRIAIGFLTLSAFPSARKPVARSDWPGTAALGVLWLAFPLTMFPFAEQRVSSALTGMLNGATPLFVAAVASLLAHRLPGRGVTTGLIVSASWFATSTSPPRRSLAPVSACLARRSFAIHRRSRRC